MSTWTLILFFIGGYVQSAEIFTERQPYTVAVSGHKSKAECEARGESERKMVRQPDVVFDKSKCVEVRSAACYSTTLDGLPNCPMPKMTSVECLKIYPPGQVGGFCEWYGYSTSLEVEDWFEKDFDRALGTLNTAREYVRQLQYKNRRSNEDAR